MRGSTLPGGFRTRHTKDLDRILDALEGDFADLVGVEVVLRGDMSAGGEQDLAVLCLVTEAGGEINRCA